MTLSKSSQHVLMFAIFLILCILEVQCKPSLGRFRFGGHFGPDRGDLKHNLKYYSGRRVDDSIRMVYFHEQTVAIVELGPKKLLLNCELIEVFKPEQYTKVLGELKDTARLVGITLPEMLTLMDQCKELEEISGAIKNSHNSTAKPFENARGILANDPFTLLKGIIPGTKWCGTGDIAKNYYDLGAEPTVDACCRTHDLCPVKVKSQSTKYSLSNTSRYTKSHCECDDSLYNCLKNQRDIPIANFMGHIYFNLVGLECVDEGKEGRVFRSPRRKF